MTAGPLLGFKDLFWRRPMVQRFGAGTEPKWLLGAWQENLEAPNSLSSTQTKHSILLCSGGRA